MKPEPTLALEILRNDMRVVEARLSDAIDHERELRILHGHAYEQVESLKLKKHDLMVKFVKIKATAETDETTK